MAIHSFRRFLVRLLLSIVVIVVAIALVLPLAPLNGFKPRVESALSRALGRKVTVSTIHLSLVKGPALVMDGITAAEDQRFGVGDLLEAEHAKAQLAIGPFLAHRQVIIQDLVLDSPKVTFTKDGSGVWSWTTIGERPQRQNSSMLNPEVGDGVYDQDAEIRGRYPAGVLGLALAIPGRDLVSGPIPDGINNIEINSASVTFVDGSDSPRWNSTYNNISLRAELTANQEGSNQGGSNPQTAPEATTRARGRLTIASASGNDGASQLTADLPFDVQVAPPHRGGFAVNGDIGPGNVQTESFSAENFKSAISLEGQKLAFSQVEAALYDGTMQGQFAFDMADPKVKFNAQGSVHNLNLDQAFGSKLGIPGKITGHVDANFTLSGEVAQFPQSIASISGNGQMSSNDLFLAGVDLGHQMAQKLGVAQLGDTGPGLKIGHAESNFTIQQGLITVENLKLRGAGGLGDATTDRGWLKISAGSGQSVVELNFPATITLSTDTTTALANSNPLYGAAVALLQQGNRLTVPVSITGNARQPNVEVDASRILQAFGRG